MRFGNVWESKNVRGWASLAIFSYIVSNFVKATQFKPATRLKVIVCLRHAAYQVEPWYAVDSHQKDTQLVSTRAVCQFFFDAFLRLNSCVCVLIDDTRRSPLKEPKNGGRICETILAKKAFSGFNVKVNSHNLVFSKKLSKAFKIHLLNPLHVTSMNSSSGDSVCVPSIFLHVVSSNDLSAVSFLPVLITRW